MRMPSRHALACIAFIACLLGPGAEERALAAGCGLEVAVSSPSELVCRVSTPSTPGLRGTLHWDQLYDLHGDDLGIPFFDSRAKKTIVLFGDTQDDDVDDPSKSVAYRGGDAAASFDGQDPNRLCHGKGAVFSISGLSSSHSPHVYSPNVMMTLGGEPITNYVFNASSPPPNAPPPLPSKNSLVPGGFEVPTGAFQYGSQYYVFYTGNTKEGGVGAPWLSYLATLNPSVAPPHTYDSYPNTWFPISKVDFTTNAPPTGWGANRPMGGHFINVAPVVNSGYLYLFGTGSYRKSYIYLARLPVGKIPKIVAKCFSQTPGLQLWDGNSSNWISPTASSDGSCTPITAIGPLALSNMQAAVGELSVQYVSQANLWLMMYRRNDELAVSVRVGISPTGPWSDENTVLDLGASATCCSSSQKITVSCIKGPLPGDACGKPQINECVDHGGIYAPYMYPVTTVQSSHGNFTMTVNYQLSSSCPYHSVLMSYQLTASDHVCPRGQLCQKSQCEPIRRGGGDCVKLCGADSNCMDCCLCLNRQPPPKPGSCDSLCI
jgi:hypothetical protein